MAEPSDPPASREASRSSRRADVRSAGGWQVFGLASAPEVVLAYRCGAAPALDRIPSLGPGRAPLGASTKHNILMEPASCQQYIAVQGPFRRVDKRGDCPDNWAPWISS